MSVKLRVKAFCDHKDINVRQFEKSIGASNGYVNSISKSIGLEKLNAIVENHSTLSIEWLLTGVGRMIKLDSIKAIGEQKQDPYDLSEVFSKDFINTIESVILKVVSKHYDEKINTLNEKYNNLRSKMLYNNMDRQQAEILNSKKESSIKSNDTINQ
jgi:hypothetical protein